MNDLVKNILLEDTRNNLLQQSKRGKREKTDGKTRYEKRLNVRMADSVNSYNNIDMNKLFKEDIITLSIPVKGETDSYFVKISFGDFLDRLKNRLKQKKSNGVELRDIIRSLVESFNGDNVYIFCSCSDWKYRFSYWATVKDITSGPPENIPANITNPTNDLGPACKHVLLVLSNTKWIIRLSSVIFNYINYIQTHKEKLYADIIYPKLYDKKYEKDVQLDLFDDEFDTEPQDIDVSQKYAQTKTRFKPGTQQGVQFAPKEDNRQLKLDIDK